jgi:hypothetical protein
MWIVLGILLFVGWLLAKTVWHVATFGVHLLLLAAIVAIIVHFIRGHHRRSATAGT